MRIEIDYDVCESNAICESIAPSVFHLNDDDLLEFVADVPTEFEALVRRAERSCPKQAIKLVD
jgi:ferredoxin